MVDGIRFEAGPERPAAGPGDLRVTRIESESVACAPGGFKTVEGGVEGVGLFPPPRAPCRVFVESALQAAVEWRGRVRNPLAEGVD
jgi:hypothetical protein